MNNSKILINTIRKSGASFTMPSAPSNVTFVNPYSYNRLRETTISDAFDYIYADGIALVILYRLFGFKIQRYSFDNTSVAPIVMATAISQNYALCFIGGDANESAAFNKNISQLYPHVELICLPGFGFSLDEYAAKLAEHQSDIVVVSMGTPLQEKVISELYTKHKAVYFTSGGFISQSTESLNYYPKIIDKLNLRFLYRFFMEKHYRPRFLKYPYFIIHIVFDLIKFRLSKGSSN